MNHGSIKDPGLYINELCQNFVKMGGKFIKSEVSDFIYDKSKRVIGLKTDQGSLLGDKVVLAAGAWSGRLAKKIGVRIPL